MTSRSSMLKAHPVRALFVALVAVSTVAAVLYSFSDLRGSNSPWSVSDGATYAFEESSQLCSQKESLFSAERPEPFDTSNVFTGEWRRIPAERLIDYERHSRIWGPQYPGCPTPAYKMGPTDFSGPGGDRTEELTGLFSAAGRDRLMEIMSWEWHPSTGSMRDWDPSGFVLRALNSRAGFLFAGDSLTEHWYQVISSYLSRSEDGTPPLVLARGVGRDHNDMILNPEHPLFTDIQVSHPDIPFSRLEKPIFTWLHTNHVFPWAVIGKIVATDFPNNEWTEGDGASWHPDIDVENANNADWMGWIKEAASGSDGWEGEEDSVVVISAGPHWGASANFRRNPDVLYPTLRKAMNVVFEEVLVIPNVHLMFRSNAPGVEQCWLYDSPLMRERTLWSPLPHEFAPGQPGSRMEFFQWNALPQINRIASDVIRGIRDEQMTTGARPSISYFDIWEMSLQRPETRFLSPDGQGDCLHFCLPGVPYHWTKVLWHFLEGI